MSSPAKDLTAVLLPNLSDVDAALEINTRERKRLFTLRRLIVESEPAEKPEPTKTEQSAKPHAKP